MDAVRQERNGFIDPAPFEQCGVDDAGGGGEDRQRHTADDDPGQEMRQVQQRLRNLLEANGLELVEHDGQHDGHRETGDQPHEIQNQGVAQGHGKVRHAHDETEIFKADPFAAPFNFHESGNKH